MFENVDGRTDDGRTDGRRTDGRTTDAGVTGILIAHLGAFGSGELKSLFMRYLEILTHQAFALELIMGSQVDIEGYNQIYTLLSVNHDVTSESECPP